MGMLYKAPMQAVAWTAAARDVYELVTPADCIIAIHELVLGQTSDVGDAAEEILQLSFVKGYTTSGSGGSTVTPVKLETGFTASGITSVEFNNTTQASTSGTVVHVEPWNIRTVFQYLPTPEARIILSPSERFVIATTAPADALTVAGTLTWEEIGG